MFDPCFQFLKYALATAAGQAAAKSLLAAMVVASAAGLDMMIFWRSEALTLFQANLCEISGGTLIVLSMIISLQATRALNRAAISAAMYFQLRDVGEHILIWGFIIGGQLNSINFPLRWKITMMLIGATFGTSVLSVIITILALLPFSVLASAIIIVGAAIAASVSAFFGVIAGFASIWLVWRELDKIDP